MGKAAYLAVSGFAAWWKQIYLGFLVLSVVSANGMDMGSTVCVCGRAGWFTVLALGGLIY